MIRPTNKIDHKPRLLKILEESKKLDSLEVSNFIKKNDLEHYFEFVDQKKCSEVVKYIERTSIEKDSKGQVTEMWIIKQIFEELSKRLTIK